MNLQEIYNKIKQHLLSQNERSIASVPSIHDDEEHDICAYRSDDGNLKCAVGVLISDESYHTNLEDKSFYTPLVASALAKSGIDTGAYVHGVSELSFDDWINESPDRALLNGAQAIHDTVEVDGWQDAMERLAESLGLDP